MVLGGDLGHHGASVVKYTIHHPRQGVGRAIAY